MQKNNFYNYQGPDTEGDKDFYSESPWFLCDERDEETLLKSLNSRMGFLKNESKPAHEVCRRYYDLYERSGADDYLNSKRTFDATKIAITAHYNRVSKIAPKITLTVKGAKTYIRQSVEDVNDWLFRLFLSKRVHKSARSSYRDALVANYGILRFSPDKENKSFTFWREHPYCILFEKPYSGSNERSEVCFVSQYYLYDLFKKLEKVLPFFEFHKRKKMILKKHKNKSEIINFYEIYKSGRKTAMWTDEVFLKIGEWKYNWLPFEVMKWNERTLGFGGAGITEELWKIQRDIDQRYERIKMNERLFVNHYLLVPQNSNFQRFSNEFGKIYEVDIKQHGFTPKHITPPIMHDQAFELLYKSFDLALRMARVSEIQSEGSMPSGLSQPSGKALKYYNDIDTSRFYVNLVNYEDHFISVAQKCLEWGLALYPKENPFKNVLMHREEFLGSVTKFAASLLPDTPGGRLDVLRELASGGVIDSGQFLELMDAPDIQPAIDSKTARTVAIRKYLERRFYAGKAAVLDPVLGYEEQKQIALQIYATIVKESEEGPDDDRLAVIHEFLAQLKPEVDKIKAEQAKSIAAGSRFGGETPNKGVPLPGPVNRLEPKA